MEKRRERERERERNKREKTKLYHLLPINGFNPDSRLTMIEGNPVT